MQDINESNLIVYFLFRSGGDMFDAPTGCCEDQVTENEEWFPQK